MIRFRVNSAELMRAIFERKWSLKEASEKSGIPINTLYHLLRSNRKVRPKTCAKLFDTFGNSVVATEIFSVADAIKFAKQSGFELFSVHTISETPEDYQIMTFIVQNENENGSDIGEIDPPF